jgi:hypothetical protein
MNEQQSKHPANYKKSYRSSFIVWGTLAFILLTFIAVSYPSFSTRQSGNEALAIASLRTISSSQANLFEKEKVYCGSLLELFKANLLDEKRATGEKSGYIFEVVKTENNCELTAKPISTSTGKRSFYLSDKDNLEIRFSTDENKAADASSPKLR